MRSLPVRAASLLVLAVLGVPATPRAETPEEIFEAGNAAYEQGDYARACGHYETILQYGIRDWRVDYNLGNAYFKRGRLGEAILHFERALRLNPTDPDVRGNLEVARSRCRDRVQPPEVAWLVRSLVDLQDRLGPDRQAVAGLVLLWGVGLLVAWATVRRHGWDAAAGWAVSVLVILAVLVGVSWRMTYERLQGDRLAVVLEDAVDVRAGPGGTNAALFTVHEGLTLEVRAERPEWIQVSLPNGLNGWVPREAVGFV